MLQSADRKRRREQVAIQYAIGRELIIAKATSPPGMSGPWLQTDFGSCRHSGKRYLRGDDAMIVWTPDHDPWKGSATAWWVEVTTIPELPVLTLEYGNSIMTEHPINTSDLPTAGRELSL